MSVGGTRDHRMCRNPGLRRRNDGDGGDRTLSVERPQRGLIQQRMQFDLVDHRCSETQVGHVGQLLGVEVGDADGPGVADLMGFQQPCPGVDISAVLLDRPVDEEEVDIVQPESGESGPAGVLRGLETLIRTRQRGGDVDLAARDRRPGDGPTHGFGAARRRAGVDQAVAGGQRGGDRGLGLLGRQLGDAETDHRNGVVVAEREGGDPRRRRHVTCLSVEVVRRFVDHPRRLRMVPGGIVLSGLVPGGSDPAVAARRPTLTSPRQGGMPAR